MPRSHARWSILLVLPILAAVSAEALRGQVAGHETSLPREFVEAFVGATGPDGAEVSLAVGQVAGELARWVEPPPADRVIGSVVQGPRITTVLATPAPVEEAVAEWRARFADAGWSPPEPWHHWPGGFEGPAPVPRPVHCLDDGSEIRVTGSRAPAGGSRIRIAYTSGDGHSGTCSALPRPRPSLESAPVPLLRAPEGVATRGSGVGSRQTGWYSSTRALGDVSVAELEAHYGRQLAAQGWTRTDRAVASTLAASTWQHSDEDGVVWVASLVVDQVSEGEMDARLNAQELP